jgi:antitoxin component of RelBE/YafQ-DinJ toxin-antitoxin module
MYQKGIFLVSMPTPALIHVKTDPQLKRRALSAAQELGVSLNAVLNNELKRFAIERSVSFSLPERPNAKTAAALASSRQKIDSGDYHTFLNNKKAMDFLSSELA